MRIRIRIREQLCILIAGTASLALMILALTLYFESRHYITQTRASTLMVTANLKSSMITEALSLYRDIVQAVSTRTAVQAALGQFNDGNTSAALTNSLQHEITSALSGGIEDTLLLQAALFPRSNTGPDGGRAIVTATGEGAVGKVILPGSYPNGSSIYLGDTGLGYPRALYPNYTYSRETYNVTHISYEGRQLFYDSTLLLGPLYLDDKSALISMSVAINNNTSRTDILGWLTIVLDARIIYNIAEDPIGLGKTGETLTVSPVPADNLFNPSVRDRPASENEDVPVNFILPPASNKTLNNRHSIRASKPYLPFSMGDFPCALDAWSEVNGQLNNGGSHVSTHNEQGNQISCGYARVQSPIVDWVVIMEMSHHEVFAMIRRLRNALLICIFSTLAAILIICFPIAHYFSKPIRALRTATENSIMIYEVEVLKETASSQSQSSDPESLKGHKQVSANGFTFIEKRAKKKAKPVARREFTIPAKVPDKDHYLQDELTDLTGTFNEMSDELAVQYGRLEDRVKQRTKELERSRDLARAADESKTLFIANVSHELRTPLNGIIGMCAVAMQEEEVARIRQSLNIIYKSSDLLLHLLNDLLTFSRNSYGQQLSIEEGIFKLEDIGTTIVSMFEKQARESDIGLKVVFIGANDPRQNFDDAPEDAIHAKRDVGRMLKRVKTNVLARGPADTGPLRLMALCGDKNRILQVLMNLVSNSLKFTPAKGQIECRIKCKGFSEIIEIESGASTAVEGLCAKLQVLGTAQSPSGKMLDFDFEIEDTGPGIPEHLRQEIFKPFVQGDLGLSKKHGGTGLGLAICAQLATLMRGGIHLRSTVDIGSTFTLSIPLLYSKDKAPSLSGSLKPGSRAASLGSSIRMEALSNKSPRLTTRGGNRTHPPSARTSIYSAHEDAPQTQPMEQPRIVGYSQPFVTDVKDDPENDNTRPGNAEATSKKVLANKNRLESIASVSQNENQDFGAGGRDEHRVSVVSHPPLAAKPSSIAILVAEDNKVNQEVIMRMLKLEKITKVTLAEDGQKALDRVRESLREAPDGSIASPFQLIFMDIQMPHMDGIEATKHIRELGFDAPIVALTAFDHETNREACKEAGMNEFLPKPLKRTALKKILEQFKPVASRQNNKDG